MTQFDQPVLLVELLVSVGKMPALEFTHGSAQWSLPVVDMIGENNINSLIS